MTDTISAQEINRLFPVRMVPEYTVQTPHPAQQVAMSLKIPDLLYGGSAGGGKLLDIYHPMNVPVWYIGNCKSYRPNGGQMGLELKVLKDVQVGDYVFNQEGLPIKVLAKSPIEHEPTYRVTMVDGESVICGERHLWNVLTDKDRIRYEHSKPEWKAKRRAARPSRAKTDSQKPWLKTTASESNKRRAEAVRENEKDPYIWDFTQTLETRDIAALVANEKKRVAIPVARATQTDALWPDTMLSPYYLGVWLGDGTSATGDLTQDVNIMADGSCDSAWLIERLSEDGIRVVSDGTKNHKVWMSDGSRPQNTLREFDLLGNKHIPEFVFGTTYADRLTVLQGIVDTDGHINERGQLEMCLTNHRLIKDVQRLMATLGLRVGITERVAAYTKNGVRKVTGVRYTIKCTPDIELASLPRKKSRLVPRKSIARNVYRYIKSMELLDYQPDLQCIQVDDPRGLYCIGETNLVTHNSSCILMDALSCVDVPGYSALILRRTWPDLNSPGAILDRMKSWMAGKDVRMRDQGRLWEFPSGAKIQFGYAQREEAKLKFQGSEYQSIFIDEASQFESEIITYLKSRLRKPTIPCMICTQPLTRYYQKGQVRYRHSHNKSACDNTLPDPVSVQTYGAAPDGMTIFDLPLKLRLYSNPGGLSHEWLYNRYVNPKTRDPETAFIPAALKDNPSLNQEEYTKQLEGLSALDKERLLNGNWEMMDEGRMFDRGAFNYIPEAPPPYDVKSRLRFWDFAATDSKKSDWTAGALCAITNDGRWIVEDIIHVRKDSPVVEKIVRQTAVKDGIGVPIWAEQEPGASGKAYISYLKRQVFAGFQFNGERATGSKIDRAKALASQTEGKNVFLVEGDWNKAFIDEASLFPTGKHDDQIDAVAGAFNKMAFNGRRPLRIIVEVND